MTIRLFTWQVQKLKEGKYPAEVLRRAFSRYERGDFKDVVQNVVSSNSDDKCTALTPFTIRTRFPVPDAELRNILSMHWEHPDKKWQNYLANEIRKMESEIDELFRAYTNQPYVVEVNN